MANATYIRVGYDYIALEKLTLAVRETAVSRHNEGPIKDTLEPLNKIVL